MNKDKELEERLKEQQRLLQEMFEKEKERQQQRCDSESSLVKCYNCNCWKTKLENDS